MQGNCPAWYTDLMEAISQHATEIMVFFGIVTLPSFSIEVITYVTDAWNMLREP